MDLFRKVLLSWSFMLAQSLVCAALPPGQVVGWGNNISGEATGIPSFPLSNGIVVTTGNQSATGTVTIAGRTLSNAVAVSAGKFHSIALTDSGTIVGWGDNFFGQCIGGKTGASDRTNGVVTIQGDLISNAVAIAAGRNFSLALKKDG